MKKVLAALTFAMIAVVARAQTVVKTHDYVWIEYQVGTIAIASTVAESRFLQVEIPKGEGSVGERGFTAKTKEVLLVIQDYESQGWELVTAMFNPSMYAPLWIMRKPKQ